MHLYIHRIRVHAGKLQFETYQILMIKRIRTNFNLTIIRTLLIIQ